MIPVSNPDSARLKLCLITVDMVLNRDVLGILKLNAVYQPHPLNPSIGLSMNTDSTHSPQTISPQTIDLVTLLQSLQALSRTIHLEELIAQLVNIILETSKADRCALMLVDAARELQVRAISTHTLTQLYTKVLGNGQKLPVQLIQHVQVTQQSVTFRGNYAELPVVDDYLSQQQPSSILCLPMLNQRQLVGVIYLEHQAEADIFTQNHIEVLNFLGNHAAVSIENARAIEEEQEKNAQLLLSELRLRTLFEQAGDAVLLIGEQGITDCNQATLDLFGFRTKAQFCAMSIAQISPSLQADGQPSGDKAMAMIQQALQTGRHRFEWMHRRIDGQDFWAEVVLTAIPDGDSHILHGMVRDISERKQLEAATLEKSAALEQAIEKLQVTQLQMVKSEKMSALGNLVAGIAHEINNPLGFISGNMRELQQSLKDITACLTAYREAFPQPGETIEELLDEVDLDFLLQDLPNMLNSMSVGCKRIRGISHSLRTFSRSDQETKLLADLHEGLDSTLLILKYRLKDKDFRPEIQIVQDYAELPEVECFPGQLNQVFMNVLANAIDMFDEMAEISSYQIMTELQPQITIRTELVNGNRVAIRIRDNGKGMPEEVRARIFERDFTTKPVGKGTGLGMAIAQQIVVETHGGSFEVESELGEGTEFRIYLPIEA